MCQYTKSFYIHTSCEDPGAHYFGTLVEGEKSKCCPKGPHERYIVVPGQCPPCSGNLGGGWQPGKAMGLFKTVSRASSDHGNKLPGKKKPKSAPSTGQPSSEHGADLMISGTGIEIYDHNESLETNDETTRLGSEGSDGNDAKPAQSRRRAEIRAAQRAFRKLKEQHVKDLETELMTLQLNSTALARENELPELPDKYISIGDELSKDCENGIESGYAGSPNVAGVQKKLILEESPTDSGEEMPHPFEQPGNNGDQSNCEVRGDESNLKRPEDQSPKLAKSNAGNTDGYYSDGNSLKSLSPNQVTLSTGTTNGDYDLTMKNYLPIHVTNEGPLAAKLLTRPLTPDEELSSLRDISSSPDFETDSTFSEDKSDLRDDAFELANTSDFLGMLCGELQSDIEDVLIAPTLSPAKQGLIESIMKDFWTIINHEWSVNIRKCAGSSSGSSSSSSSAGKNSEAFSEGLVNRKTISTKGNDGDRPPGDSNGNGGPPKRPRSTALSDKVDEEDPKFACPYRKNNPRKYTHRNRVWRSCAMSSFDTVARLKYHRIFQCERCNGLFPTQPGLKSHFMAVKSCELQPPAPADGITDTMETRLKSRKKTHRDQSPEGRWNEIYEILFPNQIGPSAYFESPQDDASQSPVLQELASYEEYSRQELPRVFRRVLEAAVTQQTQPIGDLLRSQLVNMIRESQDRVFSTYRTRLASSTPGSNQTGAETSTRPQPHFSISSSRDQKVSTSLDGEDQSTAMLENFFQCPPYQDNHDLDWDSTISQRSSEFAAQNVSSDSGYISSLSVLDASSPFNTYELIGTGTLTRSAPQDVSSTHSDTSVAPPPQTFASLLDCEKHETFDSHLFELGRLPGSYLEEEFEWDLLIS